MNIPSDLLYTRQHEWISVDNNVVTLGITDHAQQELGDIVYVELPKQGSRLGKEEAFGSVESVKAVSEIFTPVSGQITDVNVQLASAPELVNTDPYGQAWMVRIKVDDVSGLDDLMSADQYSQYLKEESS